MQTMERMVGGMGGTSGTVGTELAIMFVHLPCLFVAGPNKYDFGSNASVKILTNPTREKGELTITMSNVGASSTFQGRNQVKYIPTAGCGHLRYASKRLESGFEDVAHSAPDMENPGMFGPRCEQSASQQAGPWLVVS